MKSYIPKLIEHGKQVLQNSLGPILIIGTLAYSLFVLPASIPQNHRDISDVSRHYDRGITYGRAQNARTYDFLPFLGLSGEDYRTIENIAGVHGFHVIKEGRNIVDFFYPEDPESRIIHLMIIPQEPFMEPWKKYAML